ncbi:hypothetical protein Emag_003383 [Eimeria magna]
MLEADGALVITTPQEAALQDVRKQINFCRKVSLPVLGVVENMANSLFAEGPNKGGAELAGSVVLSFLMLQQMCDSMGVAFAGRIPLDKEAERRKPLKRLSPSHKPAFDAAHLLLMLLLLPFGLLQLLGACEGGYSLVETKPETLSAMALRRLCEYVVRCTDTPMTNGDMQQQQQQQLQQQNGKQ